MKGRGRGKDRDKEECERKRGGELRKIGKERERWVERDEGE